MALTGVHVLGETPLRDEEVRGLKHPLVTSRRELNELEGQNILAGQNWALKSVQTRLPGMLSHTYIKRLHGEMYGDVWSWAGKYRLHDVQPVGATFSAIRMELRQLFDEAKHWQERNTNPPEELAIRVPSPIGEDTSVRRRKWSTCPHDERSHSGAAF